MWPLTLLWGEVQEAPVTKWDLRKCFHYRHWMLHDNYHIGLAQYGKFHITPLTTDYTEAIKAIKQKSVQPLEIKSSVTVTIIWMLHTVCGLNNIINSLHTSRTTLPTTTASKLTTVIQRNITNYTRRTYCRAADSIWYSGTMSNTHTHSLTQTHTETHGLKTTLTWNILYEWGLLSESYSALG